MSKIINGFVEIYNNKFFYNKIIYLKIIIKFMGVSQNRKKTFNFNKNYNY